MSTTVTPYLTTNYSGNNDSGEDKIGKIQFVPLVIIIVVGFIANISVIWNGVTKRLRFKHYSDYFILSLAFADLGVVMMAIPVHLVEYTVGLDISNFTCSYIITIRETFQSAAMQTVAVLGIARLRQITRRYHMPISKRGSAIIVAIIWLNSYLLISLPMAFVFKMTSEKKCDPSWKSFKLMKIHLTFTTIILVLPTVIVTFSYLIILKKINNLAQANVVASSTNNGAVSGNNEERATPRKSRNLSVLLIMLIVTCWLSYGPLAVQTILFVYEIAEIPSQGVDAISVLFYASSAINPVLVLIMSREYRFRFPRRLGRKCRVGNVQGQNHVVIQNAKNSVQMDEGSGKAKAAAK